MGHYLGDAHVPLHTTANYNGQLTGQDGIHAFWESRLPELFADEQYDFLVGKATYIEHLDSFFWNVVLESHRLVEEVLDSEREISREFPEMQKFCFESRSGGLARLPCAEYSAAFSRRMNGMVEKRMRDAILALGSCWYTAWVDAGQPSLSFLLSESRTEEEIERMRQLEERFRTGKIFGRKH